jgi:hypothetical protein
MFHYPTQASLLIGNFVDLTQSKVADTEMSFWHQMQGDHTGQIFPLVDDCLLWAIFKLVAENFEILVSVGKVMHEI